MSRVSAHALCVTRRDSLFNESVAQPTCTVLRYRNVHLPDLWHEANSVPVICSQSSYIACPTLTLRHSIIFWDNPLRFHQQAKLGHSFCPPKDGLRALGIVSGRDGVGSCYEHIDTPNVMTMPSLISYFSAINIIFNQSLFKFLRHHLNTKYLSPLTSQHF